MYSYLYTDILYTLSVHKSCLCTCLVTLLDNTFSHMPTCDLMCDVYLLFVPTAPLLQEYDRLVDEYDAALNSSSVQVLLYTQIYKASFVIYSATKNQCSSKPYALFLYKDFETLAQPTSSI